MRFILRSITAAVLGITFLVSCSNADTTASFKVYGNCGMCQKTIEGALSEVEGVEEASWNMNTKMISVSYEKAKISEDQIKEKIAAVGYDTDSHRAKQETYDALHSCCQYERPE